MARKLKDEAPPAAAQPVHVIHPHAVYYPDHFRQHFRLRGSTFGREVRLGRLRVGKRGGRYYVLGSWLLEWLRSGEAQRRAPAAGRADDVA